MSFPADNKSEAGPPGYDTTPTLPDAHVDLHEDGQRRCRRKRRFFHITALALVALWFFSGDISDSLFDNSPNGFEDLFTHPPYPPPIPLLILPILPLTPPHPPPHPPSHPPPHPPHPPMPHYHIPPGVELHDCVSWEEAKGDFPHFATGNLTLDSASDLLFLSRGSFSSGRFDLAQSKDYNEGKVDVQLSVGYGHPRFLEIAKVCTITQGDSQGVGIFTPEWKGHHCKGRPGRFREPEFTIHVALPAGEKKDVLAVESLVADLPLFQQTVSSLGDTVYFDKVVLKNINDEINVQSVSGDIVDVSTVNAAIGGSFKADKSLSLTTINGQITADVVLRHPGDPNHVTNSGFHSTKGDIRINAKLEASGKNEDAKLSLYAHTTTTGNINIDMPSTFEGEFNLETFVGKEIVNAPDVEDPSGRGRKREVTLTHRSWKTVEGSVLWSDKGKEIGGSVLLKSTTGSLVLQL
ncbi:hypothetical protein BKA70DRAFT_1569772 [Coprinopsis sp. MPI-PUGE-AT-0042]|nr:hypothetical protein BKA70DRAFT_1569772 [Coprinopsis sp. MPI-PUGE-AT-0042]